MTVYLSVESSMYMMTINKNSENLSIGVVMSLTLDFSLLFLFMMKSEKTFH